MPDWLQCPRGTRFGPEAFGQAHNIAAGDGFGDHFNFHAKRIDKIAIIGNLSGRHLKTGGFGKVQYFQFIGVPADVTESQCAHLRGSGQPVVKHSKPGQGTVIGIGATGAKHMPVIK